MASSYNLPAELPSYVGRRMSQSFDPNTPPAPPPKPSSEEVSRQSTPAAGQSLPAPPLDEQRGYAAATAGQQYHDQVSLRETAAIPQDPGDRWLPKLLEDKSYGLLTQDCMQTKQLTIKQETGSCRGTEKTRDFICPCALTLDRPSLHCFFTGTTCRGTERKYISRITSQ